jgi:hypothetical protein
VASIDWPTALGTSWRIGTRVVPRYSGNIRTEVDAGVPIVRRRYSAEVEDIFEPVTFEEDQVETLFTFYYTTTKMGSLRFNRSHPVTGDTEEFRFAEKPDVKVASGGLNPIYTGTIHLEKLPS